VIDPNDATRRRKVRRSAILFALIAAAFYLLLSGAEVATQRSFIMIAIVLVGVLVDRPSVTFRTLTVAALGVLLLAPEALVHPSFQMSFAATLALVAGYQQGLPWMTAGADTPLGAHRALGRRLASRRGDRVAARRHRDHSVRGLSLPPHLDLRRDR